MGCIGDYVGDYLEAIKGDNRNLGYSSLCVWGLNVAFYVARFGVVLWLVFVKPPNTPCVRAGMCNP